MEIIRAREAFEKGLKRYFTGIPCKYNHIAQRMISNGCCVECLKIRNEKNKKKTYERVKEWRKKNPGARAVEARKYREKYPDKVKGYSEKYRKNNVEKIRERDMMAQRRMRAINPEKCKQRSIKYQKKKEQLKHDIAGRPRANICEICDKVERTVFDHCHFSGNFRGWICDRCNKMLGLVKDSTNVLRKMINYLEIFNESIKEK